MNVNEVKDRTLTVSGQITGMKHADAQNQFPTTRIRPIKVDGEDLIVTQELRGDRINVEVQNGLITAVISLE